MAILNAAYYIKKLDLHPHPEGGYFKEIYRSKETIKLQSLPDRYLSDHNFGTSIYYLLQGKDFSSFHKIKSDEIWHFYTGSPVRIILLKENKKSTEKILGCSLPRGEEFQLVIPAGTIFAAQPIEPDSFSLVGCTVSPGFNFDDFELPGRDELLKNFPLQEEPILKFTRE